MRDLHKIARLSPALPRNEWLSTRRYAAHQASDRPCSPGQQRAGRRRQSPSAPFRVLPTTRRGARPPWSLPQWPAVQAATSHAESVHEGPAVPFPPACAPGRGLLCTFTNCPPSRSNPFPPSPLTSPNRGRFCPLCLKKPSRTGSPLGTGDPASHPIPKSQLQDLGKSPPLPGLAVTEAAWTSVLGPSLGCYED